MRPERIIGSYLQTTATFARMQDSARACTNGRVLFPVSPLRLQCGKSLAVWSRGAVAKPSNSKTCETSPTLCFSLSLLLLSDRPCWEKLCREHKIILHSCNWNQSSVLLPTSLYSNLSQALGMFKKQLLLLSHNSSCCQKSETCLFLFCHTGPNVLQLLALGLLPI